MQKAEVQNITVHGLRHTHATFLIEAGANIKYVSTRLGHKILILLWMFIAMC